MTELTIFEFEKQFDDIMNRVELGEKFLVKVSPTEGIVLTNVKDESIAFSEKQGVINKLEFNE